MGVPEEGIRRTSITTSTFDASRGGFAGGMVSMMSARGNNRPGGALSYRLDNDALQSTASATTNAFSRQWMSARTAARSSSNNRCSTTRRCSCRGTRTTASRWRRTIRSVHSAPAWPRTPSRGSSRSWTGAARLRGLRQTGAVQPGDRRRQAAGPHGLEHRADREGSQTLSVRFNTNLNTQDSTRINPLDLLQHGGDLERNNRWRPPH
jgi:hypothetical protein